MVLTDKKNETGNQYICGWSSGHAIQEQVSGPV